MRKIIKSLASILLIPLTRLYLKKERAFTYAGTTIIVMPGVFHPGLFYSTKFILSYLLKEPLINASLLELGCGSGLISILAAKVGAHVTSSDLNSIAIQNITLNAKQNNVSLKIIHSDLFETIPAQKFDWIVINPPYYAREITSEAELAWHAGPNFEYFHKLFQSLIHYIFEDSKVIMVLTKGTDLPFIFAIAKKNGFKLDVIKQRSMLFDGKDFLFRVSVNYA